MFNINFNNRNSYDDFGLAIERRPIIPTPKRRINPINVPGRNGSLTEDEGTYEDIEIQINFAMVDRDNIYDKTRIIKDWLVGSGDLVISDDTGYRYKVKYIRTSDIDRFMIIVGRFTATFVCEPFAYSTMDQSILLTTPMSLFNPGTYRSTPYIKINGAGDITLTINGNITTLKSVDTYIELDSEIEECYKSNIPLNNKMSGEFPTFKTGENTISWTGTVTSIEINPRWRWL